MIIPIEQVYLEDISASSIQNSGNRFKGHPTGIVIEDSVNNLAFPMPIPIVDTNKLNLPVIYNQYLTLYSNDTFNKTLPWHYVIEFLDNDYIIYNTRPMDIMYPYTTQEVADFNNPVINDFSSNFLESSNEKKYMIHILIIGDSKKDVYTRQLYRKICDYIIGPTCRSIPTSQTIHSTIFPLNLGDRFINSLLTSSFR